MKFQDFPAWLRDTLLRLLPHATRPGLVEVGAPGPDSPVLLTGNFTLTVRRMRDALQGRDVWLLVANSRGINVWCAAGGGHLTHHDVIGALRASRIGNRVTHRDLVLPQLAATGVEKRRIEEATGFRVTWGPARLEDVPAFLDAGAKPRKAWRAMRFPLWERLEMTMLWGPPMAAVAFIVLALAQDLGMAALAAGLVMALVVAIFTLLPWLPVTGRKRWLTYGGFAALGCALGLAALIGLNWYQASALAWLCATSVLSMLVLSVDLAGTTPWVPSTINTAGNSLSVELLEERCTGAAQCVLVCPRDVLSMDGQRRKVTLAKPDACLLCGACIVQCPDDALQFRFDDGRVVQPETVRSTRLNLLGRRSVPVASEANDA